MVVRLIWTKPREACNAVETAGIVLNQSTSHWKLRLPHSHGIPAKSRSISRTRWPMTGRDNNQTSPSTSLGRGQQEQQSSSSGETSGGDLVTFLRWGSMETLDCRSWLTSFRSPQSALDRSFCRQALRLETALGHFSRLKPLVDQSRLCCCQLPPYNFVSSA